METTPLDGYKKIIVTLLTLIAGSLTLFVHDPSKVETIGQFLTNVLGPVLITVVGIVYTMVQGSIDKEKVKSAIVGDVNSQDIQNSPKAEGAVSAQAAAPVPQPVIPIMPTSPAPSPYIPDRKSVV